jgi:hypothetical protein
MKIPELGLSFKELKGLWGRFSLVEFNGHQPYELFEAGRVFSGEDSRMASTATNVLEFQLFEVDH